MRRQKLENTVMTGKFEGKEGKAKRKIFGLAK